MVPDVAPGDSRYVDAQVKGNGGKYLAPLINGVETQGVRAAYIGAESWAWIYQSDEHGHKHTCHNHNEACMHVVFGDVVLRRKDGRPV